MTREEALEMWLPVVEMAIANANIPEVKEALEMSIKALEQEPMDVMYYPQVEGITPTVVEPNTDCVSRQYLIEKATSWDKHFADSIRYVALTDILNAPSVTPAEKVGRWINAKVGKLFPSNDFKCSECGNILDFNGVNCGRGDANYCPNCGAKMEVEDENTSTT